MKTNYTINKSKKNHNKIVFVTKTYPKPHKTKLIVVRKTKNKIEDKTIHNNTY